MGDRQSDFVNMMLPYAIAVGKKTGLDPRLVIAQSALETGYGQSAPNNNYFGVKSHGKQGGATMATTEVYNGQPTRVNDSFRTYSDPGQSAADYAQFLLDNPRYRGVLAETTLGGQINAMGSSGYATDPQYADKLRAIATGLPISEGAMIGAETMAALGKGPTVSFLPNGDMNTGGGGMAGGNVTTSTMGGQQQQAPSIWNNLFGGALADPDKRARLAIALEGMTLNPNQALIQTQAEGIKSRADEKKAATEINRTAAWLRSQGRDDLAAAVESGALGGRDAAGIAMQPAQSNVPASFQALDLQAQAAGLKPGTPEYQKFMMTGGAADTGVPAAFAALDAQAQAAGFVPGSQEYKDFMATRGAGLAEAAKITAGAAAEAQVAAPGDIAAADKALAEIDGIKKHPGLDRGTGWTSLANSIPGTVGYDFQNRVNQVKSGAFMTAIEQMRGLGALSNAEGQTATAAVNRMDTATSKEEFLAAMSDYEAIIKIGRDRAQKKIKAPETPASPPAAAASDTSGMSDDDLINMYSGQ